MSAVSGLNLVFHSIRQGGGMERHVRDLITGFAERGIALQVITCKLDWPGVQPEKVDFVVLRDWTPLQRLNNLWFEHRAYRYIRPGWPVLAISRITGGPVDLAISGGTHIAHLAKMGKQPGFFGRRVIANESALYRNSRVIIAHSRSVRDEIVRDYRIAPEKVSVLYPPIDSCLFNKRLESSRREIRQSLGVRDEQIVLLFPAGNNRELKGARLIMEALDQQSAPFVLVVAGREVVQHPRALNLGFRKDMPALYTAADATILASKYEAFGLVGPESIACGTPVLFADTIGATEVLSEPGCYTFPRTASALAGLLQRLGPVMHSPGFRVAQPEACIHYPWSLDRYLDALLACTTVS